MQTNSLKNGEMTMKQTDTLANNDSHILTLIDDNLLNVSKSIVHNKTLYDNKSTANSTFSSITNHKLE